MQKALNKILFFVDDFQKCNGMPYKMSFGGEDAMWQYVNKKS